MRVTKISAGPENFRNGIMKSDVFDGELVSVGPIVDGKKHGYWTEKDDHCATVNYKLYKKGVLRYEI